MAKDKYGYPYDLNYELENSYAHLPNSRSNNNIANNNHNNNHEQNNFQVHHYEPKGPSPNSLNSHSQPHSLHAPQQDFVSIFTDLAHSLNVKLNDELTKNLLTLIRLGVPPDDIYIFLKECIESRSTRV